MPSAEERCSSRYSSGWNNMKEETPPGASKKYVELKAKHLKENTPYEDPDFLAIESSIFFSKPLSSRFKSNVTWLRPKDICKKGELPHFFVDGFSRFDVHQGMLGDCWVLAAVSCLAQHPKLFRIVVPENQSFTTDYAGIFRFNFWRFGTWTEVIIDDLLPVMEGRLIFMQGGTENKNEFWTALLEKAYAKFHSSYESLESGTTLESSEHFTGGLTEMYSWSKDPIPPNLFQIMQKAFERESLIGCATAGHPDPNITVLENGLTPGHAYSITDIKTVNRQTSGVNEKVSLVRIRNPWGNKTEWKYAWADNSPEWESLSEKDRKEIRTGTDDGEFWMSFEDLKKNFTRVEICNLGADSLTEECKALKKKRWEMTKFLDKWTNNVNAGGCLSKNEETFWTNPQYRFEVVQPDENDTEASVLISLMQPRERKRKNRTKQLKLLPIGYVLYKLEDDHVGPIDPKWFLYHAAVGRNSEKAFAEKNQVCGRHKLAVGHYLLIPSTFEAGCEREFLLRLFTEKPVPSKEIDEETGFKASNKTPITTNEEDPIEKALSAEFKRIAGEDLEIDAYELRQMLNDLFMKEFKFEGFSMDTCRSLVAMKDFDHSGKLGFEEFQELKRDLQAWKAAFVSFDTDKSGNFNGYELRQAFRHLDLTVSNQTFNALVQRYSNKDGKIYFDDFIHCVARLATMFDVYREAAVNGKRAQFDVDQFIQTTMYS